MIIIKLQEILDEMGKSQREFSRESGIRYPTINEMCQNKAKYIPLENLDTICRLTGRNVSEILAYEEEPTE